MDSQMDPDVNTGTGFVLSGGTMSGAIAIGNNVITPAICPAERNDIEMARIIRENLDMRRFAALLCLEKCGSFPSVICQLIVDFAYIDGKIINIIRNLRDPITAFMCDDFGTTWSITLKNISSQCGILCSVTSHILLWIGNTEFPYGHSYEAFFYLFKDLDMDMCDNDVISLDSPSVRPYSLTWIDPKLLAALRREILNTFKK